MKIDLTPRFDSIVRAKSSLIGFILLLELCIILIGCGSQTAPSTTLQNDPGVVAQSNPVAEISSVQTQKALQLYDLGASDLQEALSDARSLRRKTTDQSLKSSLTDVIDTLQSAGSGFAECTTGAPLLDSHHSVTGAIAQKAIKDSNNSINDLDEAGGELDSYTGTLDKPQETILDDLLGSIDDTADDLTDASIRIGARSQ